MPALSVIVCSHERPGELRRCLDALAACAADHEVLIVDSGSHPPLAELAGAYRERLPRLRYLYEPRPGLSLARNRGLREATGEIVAYVDDDACVTPGWAEHVLAAFDDPRIGCVGGTCRAAFTTVRPRWLSARLLQFAGITCFEAPAREPRGSFELPFGANISFRREALQAAGGFDSRFGRVGDVLLSGEEYVAMQELSRLGWKLWLQPDAVVDHHVAPARCRKRYYSRRLFWEGVTHARTTRWWRRAGGLALETPMYALRYLATRDRFYLYRATAEPLGHLAEWRRQLTAGLHVR